MLCDQRWLREHIKKLKRLQQRAKPSDRLQARIETRLSASLERQSARSRKVPVFAWEGDLPIFEHRSDIRDALAENQVVVVAGETGSGKSTQLPKICLDAGFGVRGMIGHTQPRRLAARSIAQRIAEELGTSVGGTIGYKVRFHDKTNDGTLIKLMTDGILLAEAAGDRFLEQYEVIILDEAHERSLNIDFLLGMLPGLLAKRPELKLVITSATIDAERFSEHFSVDRPVPVISVEGRTYPVELRYRGLEHEQSSSETQEAIIAAVQELGDVGDMLVFLPTERDIRESAKRLRGQPLIQQQYEILPLYARLSTSEQNKIFQPGPRRRIVLATNVAESSLTVPRVHAVIDTGTARISRYSSRLRMQRLPIEAVSQASANQRAGRCGRLGPGICVRLYDEEDFESRPEFTTPEIRRTNLASVILQAKFLGLGEVDQIPFLDPPRPETIREGYKTLFEIGAVDHHRNLTPVGMTLAKLPVDPRIGRMVLAADEEHCLTEVLIIAAALEVQDPRIRPLDRQQAADEQHERFKDTASDFMSFLKLWDFVERQRGNLSRGKFQRMCQQRFLSPARLREWGEVHRQLRQTAMDHGLKPRRRRDEREAIHRALLRGLLSCAAYRSEESEYLGGGGNTLSIWPGSCLFEDRPEWIMAAELVETSKRYGRTVARIDPKWLESLGSHLTKRSYSDPHWHLKSQSVMGYEKVTLFGLPIVPRRRVPYGPIDGSVARQLFIEKGLVEQQMQCSDHFFQHNASVREEAEHLAAKTRKREFILDDYRIHQFYSERVPEDVYDMAGLRKAIRQSSALESSLKMSLEDLLEDESSLESQAFPEQLDIGGTQLPLRYCFQPGEDDDGVTVVVPEQAVSQLHPQQLEWLVPGLLEQKLVALIRCLPKSIRRNLVPAPDTAERVAQKIQFGQGSCLEEVARQFSEVASETIRVRDFRLDKIPSHLRMRIEVIDDEGNITLATRDLSHARQASSSTESDSTVAAPDLPGEWHRDGITSWDFGELPESVQVKRSGIEIRLYPALIQTDDGALALRLLESPTIATTRTRRGIRALYVQRNTKALRSQVRHLPQWEETKLWASSLYSKQALESQLLCLLADRAFLAAPTLPRNEHEYEQRQQESGQRIAVATQDLATVVPRIFEAYHETRLALERITPPRFHISRQDIDSQLNALMRADFLAETPWAWLGHIPRYLKAIAYRVDKLASGGQAKDEANVHELTPLWNRWLDPSVPPDRIHHQELEEYRWMLEELRVSLFAQSLGTSIKISPQRLEKQWRKACP